MRCRLAPCAECEGAGWLTYDGTRHRSDIVMRNGHPAWVVEIVHPQRALPACLLPENLVPHGDDPVRRYAEAA